MVLAHCILGKFLGVGCHCFPPILNIYVLNLLPGIFRGPEIIVNVFLAVNMAHYSRYSLIVYVRWFDGSVEV